jgi:hypothetical protein
MSTNNNKPPPWIKNRPFNECPTYFPDTWPQDYKISTPPCSGQGICKPYLDDITSIWYNKSLCECSDISSGATDMFDLRIINSLSLDCPLPRIGEQIIWGIVATVVLVKLIMGIVTLGIMIKNYFLLPTNNNKTVTSTSTTTTTTTKTKSYKDFLKIGPIRVLLIDFSANILLIIAILMKISSKIAFGTEVFETILLSCGMTLSIFGQGVHVFSEFEILVDTYMRTYLGSARVLERVYYFELSIAPVYFILCFIPMLATLGLNRTLGPIMNNSFITLCIRNIGMFLYYIGEVVSIGRIIHYCDYIINNRGKNIASVDDPAKIVIHFLETDSRRAVRLAFWYCILTFLFCIPFLWPFQTFFFAVFLLVMMWEHKATVELFTVHVLKRKKEIRNINAKRDEEYQAKLEAAKTGSKTVFKFDDDNDQQQQQPTDGKKNKRISKNKNNNNKLAVTNQVPPPPPPPPPPATTTTTNTGDENLVVPPPPPPPP